MAQQSRKISSHYLGSKIAFFLILLTVFSWVYLARFQRKSFALPYSTINPQTIQLDLPAQDDGGGLITADINDDGQKDFIITKPGYIAAYDYSGQKLWIQEVDIQVFNKNEMQYDEVEKGYWLPGQHGPGVQAADLDGDRETEILFLTRDNTLKILSGASGNTKYSIKLPNTPERANHWEHLVVANFRGQGDRDILLQASSVIDTAPSGLKIRRGLDVAAYSVEDLIREEMPQPLWTRDDYYSAAHNGARIADLNADGKDEVYGGTILDSDGKILFESPLQRNVDNPHFDSIYVADMRPDIPGLEVVALEEGLDDKAIFPSNNPIFKLANRISKRLSRRGNRVFLYNREGLIWKQHYKWQEPQNAAIGDFDPNRPGLEIWCRSRYNEHQKPFVFDAKGKLIANYEMDKVAPEDWTVRGVEVIFTIDWTGEPKQLAVAKERHKSGDVAIFDPISGKFLYLFQEKADRLYVADVSGDWREELIVLNGNQLRIYINPEPNPNPNHSRLWTQNHYRRSKMTWNYYSP